jgi:dCMP deaminase
MTPIEVMKHASLLCDKSTCLQLKVGCVVAKNGEIMLEGVNETLLGEKYCQNGTCTRREMKLTGGSHPEITCSIHAEASVVAQAAGQGVSLENTEIYVTTFPCFTCARSLVKAKIGKLYYMTDYINDGNSSKSLFDAANIPVEKIDGKSVWGELWQY